MTIRQSDRWERRRGWTLRSENLGSPLPFNGPTNGSNSRERTPGIPGIGFPYHSLVATGVVNRQEWADVVRELLAEFTNGKKAPFARLVGVDVTTLGKWTRCDVSVSEAMVRQVAAKTNRNPIDLLIRVGFYTKEQMPTRDIDDVIDDEIQLVLDNDELNDEQKAAIIKQLEAWRTEDKALQERLAERDKQRRVERLTQLIEQANRP